MAPPAVEGSANPSDTDDVAAAEAQAALAVQRAQAARAKADELRRQADGPASPTIHPPADRSRSGWRRPVAVGLTAAASCALLGVGSALAWKHQVAQTARDQTATAAAVARQGVTDLMSLNFVNAEEDVQRVIDNATGTFKKDFEGGQYMLVKNLVQSRSVTKADVTGVAVQSAGPDAAEVLVAVTSQAANITNPHAAAKRFRVAVNLAKDQGRLKISQVTFI